VHAPIEAVDSPETRGAVIRFDFEAVFRTDYDRITRAIGRVIHDSARAEDLAVETFWRLWKTPQAQGQSAGAWLHRTAVRLALDELRRRERRARYERVLTFLRSPRTPDDLFSAAQEQGRVRTVLAAMPRRHAQLLLLRSNDSSYDDLANALAINVASVGTLLSRAKQAFRKEYVKRYGEP
jgi:RNA polymerase sigma-70 factor (ECF subfamily)